MQTNIFEPRHLRKKKEAKIHKALASKTKFSHENVRRPDKLIEGRYMHNLVNQPTTCYQLIAN